jgi:hypothetical protein
MQDHWQTMFARQAQLRPVKVHLPLPQRALAQGRHQVIQTNLTHCHQARVIPLCFQGGVQGVKVMLAGLCHVKRMNPQGIAVAMGVGQAAHRRKVGHGHRRQHAVRHPGLCRAGSHPGHVWRKLSRVKVAMGIDPGQHQGKLPSSRHLSDTVLSLNWRKLLIFFATLAKS